MASSTKPGASGKRRRCTRCGEQFDATHANFWADKRREGGLRNQCKWCCRETGEAPPPLPGDEPPKLTRAEERRLQQKADAEALRRVLPGDDAFRAERGAELKTRGEALTDRRLSDAAALRRNFLVEAERLLSRCEGRIVASGRAKREPRGEGRQAGVLLLSDLHFRSQLHPRENPIPFGPEEESRRLASILRRVLDFDPKRRDDTDFLLLLGGDLIEGRLGHNSGAAPLAEQFMAAADYLGAVIAHLAAEFPRLRIAHTPGNHERDTARHPHRATDGRWDGFGALFYDALRREAKALKNVVFEQTFKGYTLTRLYDAWLYLIHGDEDQIGSPESRSGANLDRFKRLFHAGYLPVTPEIVCLGHWHAPAYLPGSPHVFYNGALVPPSPWAKGAGYVARPCGQWFFVSRPGEAVADAHFLGVGRDEDRDASLNELIPAYQLPEAA